MGAAGTALLKPPWHNARRGAAPQPIEQHHKRDSSRYTADQIIAAFPPLEPKKLQTSTTADIDSGRRLTGEEFVALVEECVEAFAKHDPQLWRGDYEGIESQYHSGPKYNSRSEADWHLCRRIARWGSSRIYTKTDQHAFVEAVFDQSGLAHNEKWQGREDYRNRTIVKVCADIPLAPAPREAPTVNFAAQPNYTLTGDTLNSQFFADRHRDIFVYVHGAGKWMRWDGSKWLWCENGEEMEAAKETVKDILRLAAEAFAASENAPSSNSRMKHAVASQYAYRIKAILELAKSEPGMSINADQLDRKPVLLGVKNGVVNLHTGKLLENEPRYYITKYCPVDYDPDYSCIRWEKFIHEVLQDPDTVNSFQRILGQSVTGETDAEHIVLNVGTGANGKSIAGNVITRILGAYAVTAPPSLLAARRADDHSARSDLAMLAGSRLASVNELPGGMILDEVMVKHLAGREPISARQLYKEHFTFLPTFTVWVRTNHMPIIKGTDHGIWRRMIVIRYGRTFTEAEQDPHLEEKLMGEKEGILAWIVRGAQAYFEGGLALSASMKAEVQRYRSDSDLFGEFLDERTRADPDLKEHQHLLYQNYRYWCDSNGLRPISKRTFTEQLSERGYGQSKSGKNRYYTGLKIA